MIEDKIRQILIELKKAQNEFRDIKKDIRYEEKIDTVEYLDLEKAMKELRKQVKDYKEQWEKELYDDKNYVTLIDLKVKKEEQIAQLKEQLSKEFVKLPPKPVLLQLDTEDGTVKIQIQPEWILYLNGKEEKVKSVVK